MVRAAARDTAGRPRRRPCAPARRPRRSRRARARRRRRCRRRSRSRASASRACRVPRAAPARCSASIAQLASLSTTTGSAEPLGHQVAEGHVARAAGAACVTATPRAWSISDGIPKPTARTSSSDAARASCDRVDDLSEHLVLVVAARQAVGAVVDVELVVDGPGEQLRAAQVDPDHAAGRHDRPPYTAPCPAPGAAAAARRPGEPPQVQALSRAPEPVLAQPRTGRTALDELRGERAARRDAPGRPRRAQAGHRRPRRQVGGRRRARAGSCCRRSCSS